MKQRRERQERSIIAGAVSIGPRASNVVKVLDPRPPPTPATTPLCTILSQNIEALQQAGAMALLRPLLLDVVPRCAVRALRCMLGKRGALRRQLHVGGGRQHTASQPPISYTTPLLICHPTTFATILGRCCMAAVRSALASHQPPPAQHTAVGRRRARPPRRPQRRARRGARRGRRAAAARLLADRAEPLLQAGGRALPARRRAPLPRARGRRRRRWGAAGARGVPRGVRPRRQGARCAVLCALAGV